MKKRILITEDESIIAKDIENMLINFGYEVVGITDNGEDAIKLSEELKPDLILLDIVLKTQLDGIEAGIEIRKRNPIPVIFITAYADEKTLKRVKNALPYGYLLKPFDQRELYASIETALLRASIERNTYQNLLWITTILNNISDALIATDSQGIIRFINPQVERLTGLSEKDLIGKRLIDLNIIQNVDSDFIKTIDIALNSNSLPEKAKEFVLTDKNNNKINISVSITSLKPLNEPAQGLILILRDITEEVESKQNLIALTEQLKKSNKDLEHFAYIASHDLQEPLRMVASYIQLLQRRYKNKLDNEADEFITYAVEGVRRMKNLINDLLAYSRLNLQDLPFEFTDLNIIIKETIDLYSIQTNGKSLKIIQKQEYPSLYCHQDNIKQVFFNLINNSVKFNNNKVITIELDYKKNNKEHIFSIRDNGIGIDKQFSEKIFNIFQRLHTYKEYPGTGVGLALCKKIIEAHGGKIWYESEINTGTTFYFSVPDVE